MLMFLDLEHLKSCKILLNRVSFSASHTFYTVFAFVVKIYMQFFCTKLIGFRTHMRICNYKFFQSIPIFYHVMNALNFLSYFALGNSFVSHSLKFQQNTLELMNGICFEMPNCCFKCVLSAVHLCLNCFPAVICKVAKCSQFSQKKKKVYIHTSMQYTHKKCAKKFTNLQDLAKGMLFLHHRFSALGYADAVPLSEMSITFFISLGRGLKSQTNLVGFSFILSILVT